MLVVLGNAGADITYHVERLPRAGETLVASRVSRDLGGKGLNQAIAARRAGAQVRFVAPVGDDETAQAIGVALRAEDIDDNGLIVRAGASDTSVILLDAAGENTIISDTRQSETLPQDGLARRLALAPGDTLLLQGNLSRATTEAAILLANAAGARVVLNAAPLRDWMTGIAGRIDALIANRLEAAGWTGGDEHDDIVDLVDRIDAPLVVVTMGREGCCVRRRDDIARLIAAPRAAAVDTTGAGDVFCGTFVAEWLAAGDPAGAAGLAVRAASDMVTRVGTVRALPSRQTLARLRATRTPA